MTKKCIINFHICLSCVVLVLFLEPTSRSLFVLTQFGGHLGFYEGGLFARHQQTWLDKAIVQYISAVVEITQQNTMKQPNSRKTELFD